MLTDTNRFIILIYCFEEKNCGSQCNNSKTLTTEKSTRNFKNATTTYSTYKLKDITLSDPKPSFNILQQIHSLCEIETFIQMYPNGREINVVRFRESGNGGGECATVNSTYRERSSGLCPGSSS